MLGMKLLWFEKGDLKVKAQDLNMTLGPELLRAYPTPPPGEFHLLCV